MQKKKTVLLLLTNELKGVLNSAPAGFIQGVVQVSRAGEVPPSKKNLLIEQQKRNVCKSYFYCLFSVTKRLSKYA